MRNQTLGAPLGDDAAAGACKESFAVRIHSPKFATIDITERLPHVRLHADAVRAHDE
jgi:hypothetical protein